MVQSSWIRRETVSTRPRMPEAGWLPLCGYYFLVTDLGRYRVQWTPGGDGPVHGISTAAVVGGCIVDSVTVGAATLVIAWWSLGWAAFRIFSCFFLLWRVYGFPIRLSYFGNRGEKRPVDSCDLLFSKLRKCCNLQYIRASRATKCCNLQHFLDIAVNFRCGQFFYRNNSALCKNKKEFAKSESGEKLILIENHWFGKFFFNWKR